MFKGKEESLNFGKGIRIKIEFAEQSIDLMNQMNDKFNIKFDTDKVDKISLTNENINTESSKDIDQKIINDIPEDLNKYF